jgi:hypothetical protein
MNTIFTKHALLISILLALFNTAIGQQTLKPVPAAVVNAKMRGTEFTKVTPFTKSYVTDAKAAEAAHNAQFLSLKTLDVLSIVANNPEAISISIPYNDVVMKVDLVRTSVQTEDFAVVTSAKNQEKERVRTGVHYRGMIAGQNNSVAAFSFFPDGEVMGIASEPTKGNFVLGRLEATNKKTDYIFYNDQNLQISNPTTCHTVEKQDLKIDHLTSSPEVSGCVRLYLEADYELFVNKLSVQGTVNYMVGAFNQVATLYANDQISVQLSQLFIWVTPDNYSTSNAGTVLNQFQSLRTSYNGDLAHFTGIGGNNLGGIGYVDVLCFNSYGYSYSDINTTFSNVPTYSWTVEVMAHEIGHTMGSNHTHWCGWNGGPIDNCAAQEGTCTPGPAPTAGGTIMSYCHLSGVGINFTNGFGVQPGNLLRSRVSNSTCLAATCVPVGTCTPPTDIMATAITSNTATISWTAVAGSTGATLRYRSVGATAWNTLTGVISPQLITGLTANDEIEVTVASNCGTSISPYQIGIVFMTSNATSCGNPTNLLTGATTVSSANISWTAVAGATSYQVSYKLPTATTWSAPISVTGTSITISGLTASTSYNVQVQALCGTILSGATTINTTTSNPPVVCGTPTNLVMTNITSSGATNSFSVASGATSFLISIQVAGATTWEPAISIASTSYTFSGLLASTTYNLRVQSVCASGSSSYANTTFTTSAAPIPCGIPTDLLVHTITSDGGTCSFAAVAGVSSYLISIQANGATVWGAAISITNPSHWFSGLQAATTYNVRVQSVCTGTTSSYLTGSFTTAALPAPCGVPSNLLVNGITSSQATCTFTSVTGATSYLISYQTNGATTWSTEVGLTTTSYTFSALSPLTLYNIRVRSVCANGNSSYTTASFTSAAPTCTAPSNIVISAITSTEAICTFAAGTGANSYLFSLQVNGTTTWSTPINVTGNAYTFTGLLPSTGYIVRVQSYCNFGTSTYTLSTFTTASAPVPVICSVPTNLSVSAVTTTEATCSFVGNAVANSYVISIQQNGSTTWGTAIVLTTNSYTFTGLLPSTTYYVRVQSICDSGTSTYTTAAFTTANQPAPPPPPCVIPTNLLVSGVTVSEATCSFSTALASDAYLISIQQNGATTWGAAITLTINAHTFTGLLASTTYNVRLQSVCASGTSTYTNATFTTTTAPIACGIPTNFITTAITSNSATSSFTTVSGATSYLISIQPNGATTWGTELSITSNFNVFTGLLPFTAYNVRVQSVCASGTSTYTTATFSTIAAPIACGIPTNLAMSTITNSSATSSFTAVTGATQYLISIKTNAATTWGASIAINTTSYTFTGLLASTAFNVRVQSVCASGTSTYASANFTTLAAPATCGLPTNLTTNSITNTSATSSFNGVSGATSYLISIKTNGSNTWGMATSITNPSFVFTNLLPTTTYNVRVQSVCANGSSAFVSTNFTTLVTSASTCDKPTLITFTNLTSTSVVVNWPAMTSTGTYTMQYKRGNASWVTISGITGNTKELTGLTPNRTYSVKIRTNCSASSASSYTVNFTFQTPQALGNGGDESDNTLAQDDASVEERSQEDSYYFVENNTFSMKITPNPATTIATVMLNFETETEAKVELVSLLGATIDSESIKLKEGSVDFDITNLKSGVYLIRTTSKIGMFKTMRLIKN